jgi:hypothetical protein
LWFEFDQHEHRFFMADTRTEREGRDALNIDAARIMSPAQHDALRNFINSVPEGRPAFVVSPAMLLPRTLEVARFPDAPFARKAGKAIQIVT